MGKNKAITLKVSREMIKECIKDLYIEPKKSIVKWSKITNQTAQGKFAYPSQHLASLITKTKGKGSAARGEDLADGTEVKSCSRADQLNECRDCGANMISWERKCPACGSSKIKTDTSSHWIFPIREEKELDLLLNKIPRIILILFDKEDLTSENIRIRAWTIDPRDKYVREFFTHYYKNNYEIKIKRGEKPAPCNFHPLKYDFHLMMPKLIFQAEIINENVKILFWNLDKPKSELMPISLLKKQEIQLALGDNIDIKAIQFVPEDKIVNLRMREKILKKYNEIYKRR